MLPTTLLQEPEKIPLIKGGLRLDLCVGWDPDDEFTPCDGNPLFFQRQSISSVVATQTAFYFHPYLGKWSNLCNMFQMGRNHQLDLEIFMNLTFEALQHEFFLLGSSPFFFGSFFNLIPHDAMGEVGVISLPYQLKLLLSLRFKWTNVYLFVKHAPKSGVQKHDHYDTTPALTGPPAVIRCTMPHLASLGRESWVFGLVFVRGKSWGSLATLLGDFQGLEPKSFWSRLDWNTWVVAFLRKTGPEMQPS